MTRAIRPTNAPFPHNAGRTLLKYVSLSIVTLLGWGLLAAATPAQEQTRVLSYRMKGKVRLLFFWVGKDNVGGGTITLRSRPGPENLFEEKIEVLFGSNPERVPGGINRWGYGREAATWRKGAGATTLRETFFEGFMKYSREQSLDEVQSNNERQLAGADFVYEGIRSTVRPLETLSEIRIFSVEEDFDYRNAQPIHCGYAKRLAQGPPDRERKLANASHYDTPLGFLTAIRTYLTQVTEQHRPGQDLSPLPPLRLVYNSKVYQLEMRNLKFLDQFDLPLPSGDSSRKFEKVAKADFRNSQVGEGWHHDFSIWFGLDGPYRGIPLRIVDKPRWWLRVELNLDPEESAKQTLAAAESPPEAACVEQVAEAEQN